MATHPFILRCKGVLNTFFNITLKKCPFCCSGQYIILIPFYRKKTAVIKLLLEHNANVSLLNSSGQTAIHLSIAKEQKESIKALVLASCDVHVKVRVVSGQGQINLL